MLAVACTTLADLGGFLKRLESKVDVFGLVQVVFGKTFLAEIGPVSRLVGVDAFTQLEWSIDVVICEFYRVA